MRRKRSHAFFHPAKRIKFSTTTTPQSVPLWGFTEEDFVNSQFSSTDFYTPKTNFPLPAEGLKSFQERELEFLNLQYSDIFKNPEAPLFIPTNSFVQNAEQIFVLVNTTTNKMSFTSLTENEIPTANTACFSLVHFDETLSSTPKKFTPIFSSTTWTCPKNSRISFKKFHPQIRTMLFNYLLSVPRDKDLVFNKMDSDFVLDAHSTYNSGMNPNASSKYKSPDYIRRKIANSFVKYSPFTGHFPLEWDPVNFAHFTHQKIRAGSLLNPSYQQHPTRFSLLTIDAAVNDFCRQYDHHKQGFFAVLPLNKGFDKIIWKKNGTFKFPPSVFSRFPPWLKKLTAHPEVALVLLDKRISFDRAQCSDTGEITLEKTGLANFGTILAFFGFKSAKITANMFWDKNQKSLDFANDNWIAHLESLQNSFYPKKDTISNVNTSHQYISQAADFLSSKIRKRKKSDFSEEAQKAFFKYSDYSPTDLRKYRDVYTPSGIRKSHFTGNSTEFPYLHPDFAVLNNIRKTWPPAQTISSVQQKNDIVAHLKRRANTAIKKQQKKDANLLCSFCAQTGHAVEFCDQKVRTKPRWTPEQRALKDFILKWERFDIPAVPENPPLEFLEKTWKKFLEHANSFWPAFEKYSGFCRSSIPVKQLVFGALQQNIHVWASMPTVPYLFVTELIDGIDVPTVRFNDKKHKTIRTFFDNKKATDEDAFWDYVFDGNIKQFLCPLAEDFVYSAENIFFKESSGKVRFLQDVRILNIFNSSPCFRLYDAVEVMKFIRKNAFVINWDIKDFYRHFPLSAEEASKAAFSYFDDNGNRQFLAPTTGYFGNNYFPSLFTGYHRAVCRFISLFCGAQCSADTFIDDAHCVVSIADGKVDYLKLLGAEKFASIFGCSEDNITKLIEDGKNAFPNLQPVFQKWSHCFNTSNHHLNNLRKKSFSDYFGDKIFAQHAVIKYADGIMDLIVRILGSVGFVLNSKTAGPSRVFKQLGWISDIEDQSLLPRQTRLDKFFTLLDEIFTNETITINQIRTLMGIANSFNNHDSHFNHLKSCCALFLSIISHTKSINSVTLTDHQASIKHVIPDFLYDGLIFFTQELDSLTYFANKPDDNFLILQHVNPSVHYASNAQFKEFFTTYQDASTYAIGAFSTLKNEASPVVTIPLGKYLQDGTINFKRFRTASTHRELVGILQTLRHFENEIRTTSPPGVKIVSDSKAALWNLFKSGGPNSETLKVVRQIREILDSLNLPLVFEWRRRSDPFLRCVDLASKNLFYAAQWVNPDFQNTLLEHFNITDFDLLKNFDEKFFQFSEFNAIKKLFNNTHNLPMVLAPLNASRADSVISAVLRTKNECILICPLIYHSHFITTLRTNFNYFTTRYKQMFPTCTYNGFSALVCHVKY